MNPCSEFQQAMFDDEEKRFTKKRKQAKEKAETKANLDTKISGYQKPLPDAIDSFDGVSHILPVLLCEMKIKVGLLGTLDYVVTNNNVSSTFDNPALAEAVARIIGNSEVPGI